MRPDRRATWNCRSPRVLRLLLTRTPACRRLRRQCLRWPMVLGKVVAAAHPLCGSLKPRCSRPLTPRCVTRRSSRPERADAEAESWRSGGRRHDSGAPVGVKEPGHGLNIWASGLSNGAPVSSMTRFDILTWHPGAGTRREPLAGATTGEAAAREGRAGQRSSCAVRYSVGCEMQQDDVLARAAASRGGRQEGLEP
jgi:hypothetical protein